MGNNNIQETSSVAVVEKKQKGLSPKAKQQLKRGSLLTGLILGTALCILLGFQQIKTNYDETSQAAYEAFYQKAYNAAEARNHVSNEVAISIGNAQTVSRLEVLTVSSSEFVIKNADKQNKITSWLEVTGTGVFTVDLSAGEFIVDEERQYILARIPKPTLTECKVSDTGKQFWKDGRIFKNGSDAEGVKLSQSQMKEGYIKLEDSMKQSRYFHEAAEATAIRMTESLIREWNPNVPLLQVEVQFIEDQ